MEDPLWGMTVEYLQDAIRKIDVKITKNLAK